MKKEIEKIIFQLKGHKKTFTEMTKDEKNKISHRKKHLIN